MGLSESVPLCLVLSIYTVATSFGKEANTVISVTCLFVFYIFAICLLGGCIHAHAIRLKVLCFSVVTHGCAWMSAVNLPVGDHCRLRLDSLPNSDLFFPLIGLLTNEKDLNWLYLLQMCHCIFPIFVFYTQFTVVSTDGANSLGGAVFTGCQSKQRNKLNDLLELSNGWSCS